MNDCWPGHSKKSFDDSISVCCWNSLLSENEILFKYETSLSSVCNDELIDSVILLTVTASGLNAIEVVDLTDVNEISVKHSDVEMIQGTYKYSRSYLSYLI